MAIDVMYARQLYPTLGGETAADVATGPLGIGVSVRQTARTAQETAPAVPLGNPLAGLVVFGALVVAIMLVAQRYGEAGEFANLRASAYNVLLVSLIAVAGIPVWKFLLARFRVPGVSEWVLSV